MNRKTFIKNSVAGCLSCCGLLAGIESSPVQHKEPEESLSSDLQHRIVLGAEAPDWRRAEKSLSWIRNMLEHLDEQLDEPTRTRLLNACGRSCFLYAQGVADEQRPSPEAVEGFFLYLKKAGFPVERRQDVTIIEFGYQGEQNPQGLCLREGYCMCPIAEKDVPGLSPSFCDCSAGYVKELVERNSGMTARKVEVLESIKRGGKDCRFRLELIPSKA